MGASPGKQPAGPTQRAAGPGHMSGPRAFFPGDDALLAFRSMLCHLLDISLAAPLPDWEAARGQPFRSFQSLADYERKVLGVTD